MTLPLGMTRVPPPGTEMRALTGLRGVLATLVMLDHYAALDFTAPFPGVLLPHLYVAVDVFMVLSGFVLARTYADLFTAGPSAERIGVFLWRRMARLYPLYLLLTLVCFGLCRAGLLSFLQPDTSWPALLANLLAVQTWAWPGTSLDGPGWSISAEWAANLVFAALVPPFLSGRMRDAVLAAAAAVAVLVLSAGLGGQLFGVPTPFVANVIAGPWALGRCLAEFALGLFAWRLRRDLPGAVRLGHGGVLLPTAAALLLLLLAPRLDVAFVLLSVPLVIGLSFDRPGALRWLGGGPARWLGLVSYSIYLVHIALLPVRDGLAAWAEARLPDAPGWAWTGAMLCTAALAVALAALCRHWVELPGQRWLTGIRLRRAQLSL